jgi:hypothetical protein
MARSLARIDAAVEQAEDDHRAVVEAAAAVAGQCGGVGGEVVQAAEGRMERMAITSTGKGVRIVRMGFSWLACSAPCAET